MKNESRWAKVCLFVTLVFLSVPVFASTNGVDVPKFGVVAGRDRDETPGVLKAIEFAKTKSHAILVFPKGKYEFWPQHAATRRYFISNHDDVGKRAVAIPLEDFVDLTLEGHGSVFIFHGSILPISMVHSQGVTLKNLSIYHAKPRLIESKVIQIGTDWVDLRISSDCLMP